MSCGPLQELQRVQAGRGFAGGAERATDGGVVLDAPGSLGERASGFEGPDAVVGQKVHTSPAEYREPLRRGVHCDVVAGFGRFHVTGIPAVPPVRRMP